MQQAESLWAASSFTATGSYGEATNDWEGMLRATIGVLAIAGKYDELLKALKLKAQLERASNAEGMYEQALLSLEV